MTGPPVRVGQVTGVFGIEGAVRVLPLTDFEDRFSPGAEVLLGGAPRRVEWARRSSRQVVVKLTGVDDRGAAEQARGGYLEVPAAAARPLPEGSYYHHQLIGLEVVTASGRSLGRLVEVLQRPANDVWVARPEGGRERLLPATREAVVEVDLGRGRLVVADWVPEPPESPQESPRESRQESPQGLPPNVREDGAEGARDR